MSNVDIGRYKRIVQQYFWDPEPRNNVPESSIWCLGCEYSLASTWDVAPVNGSISDSGPGQTHVLNGSGPGEARTTGSTGAVNATTRKDLDPDTSRETEVNSWPPDFLDDFESRMWLTYRSNFPTIKKSTDPKAASTMSLSVRLRSQLVDSGGFTSDTGWGCMIRSGQSVLATALSMLRLGRGWRRGSKAAEERKLLALFADDPNAPFSIHRFVEHGALACGKHPGEWFGPSATARCIQALSESYPASGLRVYITGDGADVYEDSLLKLARDDQGVFIPTLILAGVRLGIERITPAYWEALKASVKLPQSIGIAGGRPSSSHYFVGVQGDHFFYLDPHHTRPALPLHQNLEDYTSEEIDSCHHRRLRRLHIKDMDPSMLIAFLIRDEEDWKHWRKAVANVQYKPVVYVADREPQMRHHGLERPEAVNEVETLDDDDDATEDDGELVEHPV